MQNNSALLVPLRQELYGWVAYEGTQEMDFSLQEYLALNDNLQFVKFQLHTQLEDILSTSVPDPRIFCASKIEFLGKRTKLYQMYWPSIVRQYSQRFFYNERRGRFYQLDGQNEKPYELMRQFYYEHFEGKQDREQLINTWVNEHGLLYIQLFFDNVVGRHGRFEFVDSIARLKDRVNVFYRKKDNECRNRGLETGGSSIKKLSDNKRRFIEDLCRFLRDAATKKNHPIRDKETGAHYDFDRLYVVFRDRLFRVTIRLHISTDQDGQLIFGHLDLRDEEILGFGKDEDGKYTTVIYTPITDSNGVDDDDDSGDEFVLPDPQQYQWPDVSGYDATA